MTKWDAHLRKAGTPKHPRYIPVHEIRRQLPFDQVTAILAFHAITGCDSVSQFAGHSKKTTWHVFQQHHNYLTNFRKGQYSEGTTKSVPGGDTCDEARVKLFCMGEARVWNQANCSSPILPVVTDMGWTLTEGHLVPHLLSLPPIQRACSKIMSGAMTFKMLQHPNFVYSRAYKALLIPTRYHKNILINAIAVYFWLHHPLFLFTLKGWK